ncbi:hypothetical protein GQ53DRAFT_331579 [Thozetella sp. PMI_491]|nr:hypothetical protein GQ53DRAFT_331579 [Thozetella sp. PMI_491]
MASSVLASLTSRGPRSFAKQTEKENPSEPRVQEFQIGHAGSSARRSTSSRLAQNCFVCALRRAQELLYTYALHGRYLLRMPQLVLYSVRSTGYVWDHPLCLIVVRYRTLYGGFRFRALSRSEPMRRHPYRIFKPESDPPPSPSPRGISTPPLPPFLQKHEKEAGGYDR